MRSVFNDTSQSHASFIAHLLRLCSFLTFPCINSNCSLFTNCVCSHIYCSMSLRRPVISLLSLGLCIFYPVCVSASSSLSTSERVYKAEGEQSDFKDAGNPEGIPPHQCVFLWCCIAISGAQRVM